MGACSQLWEGEVSKSGGRQATTGLFRFEAIAAKICGFTFALILLFGVFPDAIFESNLIVAFLTVVAGLQLFSWLLLFLLHVYRILMGGWDYSLAKVLVVLFVPVIGVVWVSIKGVQEKAD